VQANVSIGNASLIGYSIGLVSTATDASFQTGGEVGLSRGGTLIPALYRSGQIAHNLFTILTPPNQISGALTLGSIDSSQYRGRLFSLPLVSETSWMIDLKSIKVGNISQTPVAASGKAIVDSGTIFIAGPASAISSLLQIMVADLPSANITAFGSGLAIPCSLVSSLRPVTIALSGANSEEHYFFIPGSSLVLTSMSDGEICPLGLQALTYPPNGVDWILGSVFMQHFLTVFDYGNSQISFGVAASGSAAVISSSAATFASYTGATILMFAAALLS